MLFVKFATTIPFTWWVLIGSAVTFGVAMCACLLGGSAV